MQSAFFSFLRLKQSDYIEGYIMMEIFSKRRSTGYYGYGDIHFRQMKLYDSNGENWTLIPPRILHRWRSCSTPDWRISDLEYKLEFCILNSLRM